MKKYFIFCCCFCLILLTGCDKKKTLECSRSDNMTDISINYDVIVSFNNDIVSNYSLDMDVSLVGDYINERDNLSDSLQKQYNDFSNSKGFKSNLKYRDDGFKFSLDVDYNKISDDIKKKLSIIDSTNSYDEIKTDLVNDGYICK